jgi:hypothetical protein
MRFNGNWIYRNHVHGLGSISPIIHYLEQAIATQVNILSYVNVDAEVLGNDTSFSNLNTYKLRQPSFQSVFSIPMKQ